MKIFVVCSTVGWIKVERIVRFFFSGLNWTWTLNTRECEIYRDWREWRKSFLQFPAPANTYRQLKVKSGENWKKFQRFEWNVQRKFVKTFFPFCSLIIRCEELWIFPTFFALSFSCTIAYYVSIVCRYNGYIHSSTVWESVKPLLEFTSRSARSNKIYVEWNSLMSRSLLLFYSFTNKLSVSHSIFLPIFSFIQLLIPRARNITASSHSTVLCDVWIVNKLTNVHWTIFVMFDLHHCCLRKSSQHEYFWGALIWFKYHTHIIHDI